MSSVVEKRKEKRQRHKDIIEIIVYFATQEEPLIPTEKKIILSEIIVSACEYISDGEEVCDHYGTDSSWQEKVMLRFPEIIERFGDDLHPELRDMLMNLSYFRKKFIDNGLSYGNAFYDLFKIYSDGKSFTTLPAAFSNRIKKEVLPGKDSSLVDECKAIAKIMTNFIRKDIEKLKTP